MQYMHDTIIDSATIHVHSAIYDTLVITVVNWDQKNINTNISIRIYARACVCAFVLHTRVESV